MKQNKLGIPGRLYLLIAGIFFLFPFLICLLMAVKTRQDRGGVFSLPDRIHWENFANAIEEANIISSLKNSIIITLSCVVIIVFVSATAAYAIGRQYHKRFYRIYEAILIASMMIPFQAVMIPVYKMYRNLNLLNTRTGAVIMISGMAVAYCTIMIIGFVRRIPIELEEAAMLEGAGRFRICFTIVMPLLKPILATVATLQFLSVWNEFNVSILLLQSEEIKTIPMQQYVFFGAYGADYNTAFAAAVITMVPVVIFFLVLQRYVVAGMTAGAVKG